MVLSSKETASSIAEFLGAELFGDALCGVTGINEIHCLRPGDLTFSDHPKYVKKAVGSVAQTIIVKELPKVKGGKTFIVCKDPFESFVQLCSHHHQLNLDSSERNISESAVLMPGVHVGRNVSIGDGTVIHPNVTIYDGTIIGNHCTIHSGSVIGSDAFYYNKKDGHYRKLYSCGSVRVEDHVEIGAGCTIDRGSTSETTIGAGTKMDNQVHVGHDTVIGKNCLFAAQVGIAGVVVIEDDVILWGQVGVQKDLTIGKGAVVLGQSGIGKDLESGVVYFGSPVREARTKMKELAQIKRLPELVRMLDKET